MSNFTIPVRVSEIKDVAPAIREFTLVADNGEDLLAFSAGSHVVVTMKGEGVVMRNAYSLVSDPNDVSGYKISVRLQEESRGGSVFMHTKVKEGDVLSIAPPSNLFAPYWGAKKHILIAGGVGVTPFMSYIPQLLQSEETVEMHYMFHSSKTGAYVGELAKQLGSQLFCYDSDKGRRADLSDILSNQPVGTHVYICGPQSLIDGVLDTADGLGWPKNAIHFEAFKAPEPGKPFDIELSKSGVKLHVKADSSILETLEAAEVPIESSCRGGVCGRCFVSVLDGDIEHRDEFLSADEKASKKCIMPCVSRATGPSLVLDL
ncbi:MAG: PDR/VanB family oxidoreductase [Marinomonas sp.]